MEIEKFTPSEQDMATRQDVEVGVEETSSDGQTLEQGLGLEDQGFDMPQDPDVQKFLDIQDGKEVEKDASSEGGSEIQELIEANKRLASRLGQQGSEVIGPLRQENQELRDRLSRLEGTVQQSSSQTHQSDEEGLAQTIRNLYGPQADVEDPSYRAHAQAHMNAGNRLGQAIEQQLIAPLKQEIESLKAELSRTKASSLVPQDKQEALLKQYPSLASVPEEHRVSVMRDLLARPTSKGQDPSQYVESTTPTAPVKRSNKAAADAFDSLPTDKQEIALGQMLARRGMSSMGLA